MNTLPPWAWVVAGAVVIVALARFAPSVGGWVLLAIVLVVLYAAERGGVFDTLKSIGGA